MEIKELRKKTTVELHKKLADLREKMRELRFKDANKQLKNVREIRAIRQGIARIMMLLNEKNKTVNLKKNDSTKEKLVKKTNEKKEK